jgi:uncharacterized protein (TIGR03086 family)
MDTLDRLDGAFASTARVMARVSPDQLSAPTPCVEWDVRGLINHTTGVVARFAASASRTPGTMDPDADWVGTDPRAIFEQAARTNLAAWSQPDALVGTCQIPMGELPAELAAGINFLDTLVHGWDLAKALGLDPSLDSALAAAGLEFARMMMRDEFRGPRGFGPAVAVADGAPTTSQLVAFLGRQP